MPHTLKIFFRFLKNSHFWEWVFLAAAAAGLLFSVVDIFREFRSIHRQGVRFTHVHRRFLHRIPLPSPGNAALQAGQIQGWMTFRYLNTVFHLPADYLKHSLGITAKQYPDLTVDSLAGQKKQNPAALLQKVQQAIADFQNSKPVTASPHG